MSQPRRLTLLLMVVLLVPAACGGAARNQQSQTLSPATECAAPIAPCGGEIDGTWAIVAYCEPHEDVWDECGGANGIVESPETIFEFAAGQFELTIAGRIEQHDGFDKDLCVGNCTSNPPSYTCTETATQCACVFAADYDERYAGTAAPSGTSLRLRVGEDHDDLFGYCRKGDRIYLFTDEGTANRYVLAACTGGRCPRGVGYDFELSTTVQLGEP